MIGKTLGGRYTIIKHLGTGGFSNTYLAEDRNLPYHHRCVVKQLKTNTTDASTLNTARQLFQSEAETLYQLGQKCSQIPQLLAHFEEDQEFYLVQEFIDGHDLSTEIASNQRFTEEQVVHLLQDVLQILDVVHQENVIHRDIKPRNLIRRQEDGKLVLIDFGAVKQISTQVIYPGDFGHGSITIAIGTQGYMPNEQQGGKPRFSSDIYALGIIAIQALTGLSPNQLHEDAKTGEIVWRDQCQVSQRLATILDKMVRSHFKDRYRCVQDVLRDLQKITDTHILTTAISGLTNQNIVKSRHGWLVAGAALVMGLAGFGYWQSRPASLSNLLTPVSSSTPVLDRVNTLSVHTGAVFAIAFSPDGKTFASGSGDKTIKLWKLSTGELLQSLTGHSQAVVTVAISPNGQTLVSGSRDHTIKLWNLQTGELRHTLAGHTDGVQTVAISSDGQTLVSGSRDRTLKLWNLQTGAVIRTLRGHTAEIESIAISPNGQVLMSGSEDQVAKLWNLKTGELLRTLTGHDDEIEAVTISPDGQTLVSGGKDKTFVWQLGARQSQRSLTGQSGFVRATVISPNGQTLITAHADNTIKFWNLKTGDLQRTFPGHLDWVLSVAISPDGRTLISGSRDKTIQIWRVQS
jgi:WD40 repeat protein/tRNA A-37 threonylcarbamoyl transferase component Bud32